MRKDVNNFEPLPWIAIPHQDSHEFMFMAIHHTDSVRHLSTRREKLGGPPQLTMAIAILISYHPLTRSINRPTVKITLCW
jgi:hypothetical protein